MNEGMRAVVMVKWSACSPTNPSLNPAEVYNFSVKLYLKSTKINKKGSGLAHFLEKVSGLELVTS